MTVNIIDIDDLFQTHNFMVSSKRPASKFIILEKPDELILITGKIEKFPYHAKLIKWYCEKNNLACSWVHKPDFVEIYEDNITICGGGYVKFNDKKNTYEFYGFSTAYGSFDNEKLNIIINQAHQLNSVRILLSK